MQLSDLILLRCSVQQAECHPNKSCFHQFQCKSGGKVLPANQCLILLPLTSSYCFNFTKETLLYLIYLFCIAREYIITPQNRRKALFLALDYASLDISIYITPQSSGNTDKWLALNKCQPFLLALLRRNNNWCSLKTNLISKKNLLQKRGAKIMMILLCRCRPSLILSKQISLKSPKWFVFRGAERWEEKTVIGCVRENNHGVTKHLLSLKLKATLLLVLAKLHWGPIIWCSLEDDFDSCLIAKWSCWEIVFEGHPCDCGWKR